jgi:hypothetical protein
MAALRAASWLRGQVGTREGQNSQLQRSPTCPGKETQPRKKVQPHVAAA